MIVAYRANDAGLERLNCGVDPAAAEPAIPAGTLWIDLLNPTREEEAAVSALGAQVPTLADMEEIEISNRLYHENDAEVMTVVLPGQDGAGQQIASPVAFILSAARLVTVRHHSPRPFETFPGRAKRALAGYDTPERIFLGLVEEIGGRLADLLEQAGKVLDQTARGVFGGAARSNPAFLQEALERVGQQSEMIGRVRLAMLTMDRALSFYGNVTQNAGAQELIRGEMNDLRALTVHADFLTARVGLVVDATLGMINLAQNTTIRIVSVVTMLFLPPTLVASIYGMNFPWMPWIHNDWGFLIAVALMLVSAVGTWAVFKRRGWL